MLLPGSTHPWGYEKCSLTPTIYHDGQKYLLHPVKLVVEFLSSFSKVGFLENYGHRVWIPLWIRIAMLRAQSGSYFIAYSDRCNRWLILIS